MWIICHDFLFLNLFNASYVFNANCCFILSFFLYVDFGDTLWLQMCFINKVN